MQAPVRSVAFAQDDRHLSVVTNPITQGLPTIYIFEINPENPNNQAAAPILEIVGETTSKINQAVWGPQNATIFSVTENSVCVHDSETGQLLRRIAEHSGTVGSISFSVDRAHFLTTSDDRSAKLFDTKSLELLKTYETKRQVNAGSISPIMDHVLLGGGHQSQSVSFIPTAPNEFHARVSTRPMKKKSPLSEGTLVPFSPSPTARMVAVLQVDRRTAFCVCTT
eukprot:TRINITY_DN8003_c0_g2_i1.p1 TRINITY_DN8003_c0_g2~~TRINITY_DN8003_c0_g2_i1.p1  ORF type:complete len:224 (-),score=20.39 TRINITY_DN8003_c0_g2_i1:64-735(-)